LKKKKPDDLLPKSTIFYRSLPELLSELATGLFCILENDLERYPFL
jgi:hypothetical protein